MAVVTVGSSVPSMLASLPVRINFDAQVIDQPRKKRRRIVPTENLGVPPRAVQRAKSCEMGVVSPPSPIHLLTQRVESTDVEKLDKLASRRPSPSMPRW